MASKKDRKKRRREQQRQNKEQIEVKQKERYEQINVDKKKTSQKKKKIIIITVIIAVLLVSLSFFFALKPGNYDDFAKCLTEKGAVMYGENWCQYTNGQKGMFGNSFKYINYEVKRDLDKRPTWIIDGKTYETVQSFERLATLTGCEKYLDI